MAAEEAVAAGSGTGLLYSDPYTPASNHITYSKGTVNYNGHKETYYTEEKLPGKALKIPGRHVAKDGTIRDEKGYIVVATDNKVYPKGTVIQTSIGPAKVYDSTGGFNVVDIYVNGAKFKAYYP